MAAEPARPEPVLHNGRGHNSERPAYRKKKETVVVVIVTYWTGAPSNQILSVTWSIKVQVR